MCTLACSVEPEVKVGYYSWAILLSLGLESVFDHEFGLMLFVGGNRSASQNYSFEISEHWGMSTFLIVSPGDCFFGAYHFDCGVV